MTALYIKLASGGFRRTTDCAVIPEDPENTDYQAVLAWLEDHDIVIEAAPAINRRAEILAELQALDLRSIRPSREFTTSSDSDVMDAARAILVYLENEAQSLRDELQALT